jgi:uncharacterized protein (TIGR02231 family)
VEEVRIFLRGAEIKRRMVIDSAEGKNTAVFDGLPQDVRPESINASVEKGGTLISAEFEVDNFREPATSREIEALKEKLEKLKDSTKEEKSKLDVLVSEEKFLESNRQIGGESGFSLKDLKDIERYFRERKEEINSSRMKIEKRLEDLKEETERVTKEIGSFPTNAVRYAGKITVEFHAPSKGKAEIIVSYFVNNAWWRPFHEIRMNEIGGPVTLSMKGNIVQNTGEDWNDVSVKLSTGNPTLGNMQPTIHPWYVDLIMPQKQRAMRMGAPEKDMAYSASKAITMEMAVMESEEPVVQISEANTTVEFVLPSARSIPSSNKPSKVELSKHALEADVFYYCASKLDTDAFLLAKIDGWESLNLLAGEVSIFQGNEYVGKTHLDPATMDGSMEISLGRDKGIIVTRERGKDLNSKGLKNNEAVREWIITVRNTRSKAVKLKLVDQLPVSVNSAVVVKAAEISGAEQAKDTGILTWMLDIPAGGSVKKVLRYEVTYPKNGTVYLN